MNSLNTQPLFQGQIIGHFSSPDFQNIRRAIPTLLEELSGDQRAMFEAVALSNADASIPPLSYIPPHEPYRNWQEAVGASARQTRPFKVLTHSKDAIAKRRADLFEYERRKGSAVWENLSHEEKLEFVKREFPEKAPEDAIADFELLLGKNLDRTEAHRISRNNRQKAFRVRHPERVRAKDIAKMKRRREKEKAEKEAAPFVCIDAEGTDVGAPFKVQRFGPLEGIDLGLPEVADGNGEISAQDHHTFLWGAAAARGPVEWLGTDTSVPLSGDQIREWVVQLPKKFPKAIFVMFAGTYDITQMLRDLPYESAWEVWRGIPYEARHVMTSASSRNRWAFCGRFAIRLFPGKYIEIGMFRDPDHPRKENGEVDCPDRIRIYETFGFFQSSFLKAISGFGDDLVSPEDLQVIEDGKQRRKDFSSTPIADVKRYTSAELRAHAAMMTQLRAAMKDLDIRMKHWYGAGCIAQAMMDRDRIPDFYPEKFLSPDGSAPPVTRAALRSFVGGRAEMIKQGVHNGKFWSYDISSAYPHVLRQLPSMRNGTWQFRPAEDFESADATGLIKSIAELADLYIAEDGIRMTAFRRSREQLLKTEATLSPLSMVSIVRLRFLFPDCRRLIKVSGHVVEHYGELPFYPLPIRAEDGTIYFPRYGDGTYMVEEARAALRWLAEVYKNARVEDLPMVAVLGVAQFIPKNDARPFAQLIEKAFSKRAAIVDTLKDIKKQWQAEGKIGDPVDTREKVLKLGINSVYGKTAQSTGSRLKQVGGEKVIAPPRLSNPFYAAATTATTRAMLLDATRYNPEAIISFATDGIFSLEPLPHLHCPDRKELGTWEVSERQEGVFVKAGIYTHKEYRAEESQADSKTARKMRGIHPANLGQTAEAWLIDAVPKAWGRDDQALRFEYKAYKTMGAAIVSPETWKLAGHWIRGMRVADVQTVSLKRDSSGIARLVRPDGSIKQGERRRAKQLFSTRPAENPGGWALSRMYSPDWLDKRLASIVPALEEQKTLQCKGGMGFDFD